MREELWMIAVRTAPAIIPRTGFENMVRIPVNSGTFASGFTAPLMVSIPVIRIAEADHDRSSIFLLLLFGEHDKADTDECKSR